VALIKNEFVERAVLDLVVHRLPDHRHRGQRWRKTLPRKQKRLMPSRE